MTRLTLCLITIALTAPARAEMYRCTDAAGHVTFSQIRCAEDAAPAQINVSRPSAQQAAESQRYWEGVAAEQDAIRAQRAAAREIERQMAEQEAIAAKNRRETAKILDKWGAPTSTFKSGGYESRTYQHGNTIRTIRTQDGQITGSSTYRSNR